MSATSECPKAGRLRAYLDGQLPPDEHRAIEEHLSSCLPCRARLEEISTRAAGVSLLVARTAVPDANVDEAWHRFRGRVTAPDTGSLIGRIMSMWHALSARSRGPAVAAVSVAVVAAIALVPPLRTAAAEVLDVFRVKQLKVISFDPDEATALSRFQEQLFTNVEVDEPEPIPVTSADEASSLAGYPVRVLATPPEGYTLEEFSVTPQRFASAEIDVEAARQLLELAGLPTDALPSDPGVVRITAVVPPMALLRYVDSSSHITIHQATSPEVSMPPDLDLTELGSLGLQLLGLWPEEADRISASIDWANTLVIPLPNDATRAREISVNGYAGYLLESEDSSHESAAIWQEGSILYAVTGDVRESVLLRVAESLQ